MDLVIVERPEEPYIILESHNAEKGHGKGLHILKYTKNINEIKIGRGHQCQLRIPDISVSRIHAFIRYTS